MLCLKHLTEVHLWSYYFSVFRNSLRVEGLLSDPGLKGQSFLVGHTQQSSQWLECGARTLHVLAFQEAKRGGS